MPFDLLFSFSHTNVSEAFNCWHVVLILIYVLFFFVFVFLRKTALLRRAGQGRLNIVSTVVRFRLIYYLVRLSAAKRTAYSRGAIRVAQFGWRNSGGAIR